MFELFVDVYRAENIVLHSDIWSGFALTQCAKYLARAVEDRDDEALEKMCLASTAAGVGFGEYLYPRIMIGMLRANV